MVPSTETLTACDLILGVIPSARPSSIISMQSPVRDTLKIAQHFSAERWAKIPKASRRQALSPDEALP